MAGILWNTGERAIIAAALSGQAPYGTPQLVPTSGGNWGLGLGTRVGGVGSTKSDLQAQILEVGTTTANGYARAIITRDETGSGWPDPTKPGSSYQTTGPQVSFSFTGAPSPNGATLWFVAGDSTVGHDNCLFGADTAATRTFGNGDTERVTPTYQQT